MEALGARRYTPPPKISNKIGIFAQNRTVTRKKSEAPGRVNDRGFGAVKRCSRQNWRRPLPRPIVLPDVPLTLATIADVRDLVHPVAVRMVLAMEGIACRP